MNKVKIFSWKWMKTIFVLIVFILQATSCRSEAGQTDENNIGSDRAIQNKGSDTLVNVALAWAENYRLIKPDISIAVTGGGSGTGIGALINGTVDLANASRAMSESEYEEARANGIEPVEHIVAIDALAVIVHPENPVSELTIGQLSDIYIGEITNWQEVGGNDATIVLLSRETNSGTHVYFLEEVVRHGDPEEESIFAPQTILMPSSVGITSELRRNPNAIGYDGLGYVDPEHEKIVAVSESSGSPFFYPSVETALAGTYPLSRNLFMYTAGQPSGAIADYLEWILSPGGQMIVAEQGFVPIVSDS
jgi:phosphate transport system substrate-binding protein